MEIKQSERDIRTEKYFRQYRIRAEDIDKNNRTIALSFASEMPVEQWFGTEQLVISPQTINLERIANGVCPLLINHDPNQQIGIVESAEVIDSRVKSLVRFSKSDLGEEIFQDVTDNIRQGVSFGYTIDAYTETENGILVNALTVFEVSICSIPADSSVGVGRSLTINENTNTKVNTKMENETKIEQVAEIKPVVSESEREAIVVATRSAEMKRISEIDAIASGNVSSTIPNVRELALDAKKSGASVESFRATVLDEINKRQSPVTSTVKGEFTSTDTKDFSVSRAVAAAISGDWSGAKFEREMMDHCSNKAGRGTGGVYIPYEVIAAKRALSTSTASGAVATQTRYDMAVNPLYANSVTTAWGATQLNGMTGVVKIPRLATSYSVAGHTEGDAFSNTDGSFDSITLSPNAYAAQGVYSKELFLQSGGNVDQIIINDIYKQIPLKLDAVAIAKVVAGASAITCAADLTYDHILAMETSVLNANVNPAFVKFAVSPAVAGQLKSTPRVATGLADFVMKGGMIDDYSAIVSSQMIQANGKGLILCGDGSEIYVATFGNGIEIITDNVTLASNAQVKITATVFADVALRHNAAFAKITDATL